jgi:hypothetical protein
MEWDGIEEVKGLLKEKHVVQRERTPFEVIFYAVLLYLGGLSLKGVQAWLLGYTGGRTAYLEMVSEIR